MQRPLGLPRTACAVLALGLSLLARVESRAAPLSLSTSDAFLASNPYKIDAEALAKVLPVPDQFGQPIGRDSADMAWQAAGEATEARASASHMRAAVAREQAAKSAGAATATSSKNVADRPGAAKNLKSTEDATKAAIAFEEEAKKILDGVEEKAYKKAKATAEAQIKKMEAEAAAYFKSLLAKLAALAVPKTDAKSEAAAKAAQPYIDVQLHVEALVLGYNTKAIETVNAAQQMVQGAFQIATLATQEQANGDPVMAQRHMMQAHGMIGKANELKGGAVNMRKLADSLNSSIPAYMKAAQMAAIHVLATFTGLQVAEGTSVLSGQQAQASKEARDAGEDANKKADAALASLDSDLALAASLKIN